MVDTRAIRDRAQYTYATTNPGNLGKYGVQVLLQDVPALAAEAERVRAIEALVCNACGQLLGEHMWGYHGPGPFKGLACPTPEARAKLDEMMAEVEVIDAVTDA